MALPYDKIFSRVLNKINDPKELSLDETDFIEIYTERLHSVMGNPRIRGLFSKDIPVKLDDEIQEMTYTLGHSVDGYSDDDFVLEILALGMTIEWLQPQIDSVNYTLSMVGGKEEKMLQNHYKPMQDRLERLKTSLNKMIRDYGYRHNSYIEGGS